MPSMHPSAKNIHDNLMRPQKAKEAKQDPRGSDKKIPTKETKTKPVANKKGPPTNKKPPQSPAPPVGGLFGPPGTPMPPSGPGPNDPTMGNGTPSVGLF